MFKGLGYISDVNHVIDIKSSCDRRVLVIGRYVEDGVTPPTELRGLERAPKIKDRMEAGWDKVRA